MSASSPAGPSPSAGPRLATVVQEAVATKVTRCRSCGEEDLRQFLSLGETPIANRLVTPGSDRTDPVFPLAIGHCGHCSLVQLTHELPDQAIFDEDYPYFSSFSDTLREHSEAHALSLIEQLGLGPDSFVLEIASNDGYLLRTFAEHGIPVLGIEPTPGPAKAAREVGVPTIEEFFTPELARRLVDEGKRADVVIANNVMAHVPDLNGFVEGLATVVKDDGVLTVENPNVWDLIEHGEFDTIYHEHFCYFSTLAVEHLMRRHGLPLVDVQAFPDLHGGTLRWRMSRSGPPTPAVAERLAAEQAASLDSFDYYADFGVRVSALQRQLVELLRRLKQDGARIAAYGAAAKGATLMNSSGIDKTLIDFVVDRNVHKQGKLVPGARIPIVPPEKLLEAQPDYALLLVWNIAREVLPQQEEYRRRGGRFIVPVPELEIR